MAPDVGKGLGASVGAVGATDIVGCVDMLGKDVGEYVGGGVGTEECVGACPFAKLGKHTDHSINEQVWWIFPVR